MPAAWESAPLVGGESYEAAPLEPEAPTRRGRSAAPATPKQQRPTEQMAKYSLFSQARYDLDEMENILQKYGTPSLRDTMLQAGASPVGLVGPLATYMQSGSGKRYYAAAGRLADSIEKAYTGAQSSELEHLRYISSNIPGFGDDPATVRSKLLGIRRRLNALDSLSRGEIPEIDAVQPTPAPAGQMGPPSAPAQGPKRLRFNPATGDLEPVGAP